MTSFWCLYCWLWTYFITYCFYCWLWRPHCLYLEISIGKRPKYFKASDFPCCVLNNTHFFLNRSRKLKKFIIWGKVGTSTNKMVYPEGIFFMMRVTIAYVVDKQNYIWRRYLLLQRLCVPSVKTTTHVCNRFNTSFCARDHKTNQAISNLNRKFWNKSTQQIKSTTFLTDLCFIKKFKYF